MANVTDLILCPLMLMMLVFCLRALYIVTSTAGEHVHHPSIAAPVGSSIVVVGYVLWTDSKRRSLDDRVSEGEGGGHQREVQKTHKHREDAEATELTEWSGK